MPPKTRHSPGYQRHPAEITSDRLGDHLDRWYDTTDGPTRDAIGRVRAWLDAIVDKARPPLRRP